MTAMSWLNEFLHKHTCNRVPPIFLNDGTSLSVQIWFGHFYTNEHASGIATEYCYVTANIPMQDMPPSWATYCISDRVYMKVPIELVHYFIASHGGIDYEKTLGDGNVLAE